VTLAGPLVLIIRDGWGVADEDPETARRHGNAVKLAHLPVLDHLLSTSPHSLLQASGEAVGLPPGQMGNSEVGHQNLGAGRITYQDLMRITLAIRDGSFDRNPVLLKAMGEVRRTGAQLHLLGLASDGGVHSHLDHLYALLRLARAQRLAPDQVLVHPIMDGRDTPPRSGAGYLQQIEAEIRRVGAGRIATVIGRYYSMDRDNRWDRTGRAYAAYVEGRGRHAASAAAAIQASYEADRTDEFVEPAVIVDQHDVPLGQMRDGDAVIFFNFRPDRARQLTRCLTHSMPEGVSACQPSVSLHVVCMTEYDPRIPAPVAFPPETVENPIGQVVADAGLRQLRIAETEKYAHVTYFYNGGREAPFEHEDRILVPSPKIATYDLQPAMSAPGITDELLARLDTTRYDLVVLNFANADMVGHTGDLDATITALEVVDGCIGRIIERVARLDGITLVTGDHGNAERMIDDDGTPLTAHTTNPVHLILVGGPPGRLADGIFADVAPTMLELLGLPVPREMTGSTLLRRG
jgi:2,3-bisphosphoglycerate-independent phosphoglycerate mutase